MKIAKVLNGRGKEVARPKLFGVDRIVRIHKILQAVRLLAVDRTPRDVAKLS